MPKQQGQSGPRTRTSALHGPLGDTEQPRGISHRVSDHVDGKDGGALFTRQSQQRAADFDRGVYSVGAIWDRGAVLGDFRCRAASSTSPIDTGVNDDAMQPTAHRGVPAECSGAAVRGEHRVLNGVLGVLNGGASFARNPVQADPVPQIQLA